MGVAGAADRSHPPSGRLLTVACQIVERNGRGAYRPITARDAAPAEVSMYLEEFPND